MLINVLLCIWGGILAVRSIGEMELFDLILLLDALTYVTALILPCALLQISDQLRVVPEEWKLIVPAAVTVLFTGLSVFSSVLIIRASSAAGDYSIWLDMPHLLQRAAVLMFAVSAVLKFIRIHQTYPAELPKLTEKEEAYWDRITTAYSGDAVRTGKEQIPQDYSDVTAEAEETELEKEELTECPGCGRLISESLDKCPHCGTELISAESISELLRRSSGKKSVLAKEEAVSAEEELPDGSEKSAEETDEPLSEGPVTECPGCGKWISESLDRCPHCGAELISAESMRAMFRKKNRGSSENPAVKSELQKGKIEESAEETDEPLSEGPVTECPECGKWISESLDRCPHCGAELISAESMRTMFRGRKISVKRDAEPAPLPQVPEPEEEIRLFD